MEIISICLSDIKPELVTTGKNGKEYVSLVVMNKKETDQWGNDLMVYHSQTKEEREAKANRNFVGSGKTISKKC